MLQATVLTLLRILRKVPKMHPSPKQLYDYAVCDYPAIDADNDPDIAAVRDHLEAGCPVCKKTINEIIDQQLSDAMPGEGEHP